MSFTKSQLPVFVTSNRAPQSSRRYYLSAQLLVLSTITYLLLILLRPICLNIHSVVSVFLFNSSKSPLACSAATIQYPTLHGAEFLSLDANLVSNYSAYIHSGYYPNHGSVNVTEANFCNVTISYTHPGQNDILHVQVWMPAETWNGRMQGIGGGGWVAGLFSFSFMGMTAAIGEGYAAVSTDAGIPSPDPRDWALLSPGNVNLYHLQNLASVSLNDAAIIGKDVVNSFYGQPPVYSYWSGCSQGGRQGLMLAQRYPDAYDGIAAAAPAINWNEFFIGDYWATFVMDQLGEYPHPCEIDAITAAAISACDSHDGVVDGVIADPETCNFNPRTLIGTTIKCTNSGPPLKISSAAAAVVQATWAGAKSLDNSSLWFGVNPDVVLTGDKGLIGTSCTTNATCIAKPFTLSADWIRLFLLKDANSTLANMTHAELEHLFHASVQQYSSVIGTSDPNLKEFRDRGGKMITYHGLCDGIISPLGSKRYYDAVTSGDSGVHDYYRLFFAPGLGHCFGGAGAYPDTAFDSLRAWVEDGVAPDILSATSLKNSEGRVLQRPLCAYPKKQYYNGTGDGQSGQGFYCE